MLVIITSGSIITFYFFSGLFQAHEVDMATFPSLVEKDLCEIGISAWGARRKIMLLISGKFKCL